MSTGVKSLSTLTVALALFGLAGSAVMVAVPGLFAGPVRPEFTVFLVAGVAAIVLTAGFFGYIYRLGMGFGRTVLVLAAGYNALIAAVKLGLAPAALYQANREQAFDAAFGDPNELWFYLGVGSGVLLLYLLGFGVMYSVFRRRFRRRSLSSEPPPEQRGRLSNRTIVVGVVVLVAIAASFLWIMPVSTSGYRPSPTSSISSQRSVLRLRWPWSWPPCWPTRLSTRSRSGPSVWETPPFWPVSSGWVWP